MKTVLPAGLKRGATLGVVSPSDAPAPERMDQLAAGSRAIEAIGLHVELAPHALSNELGYAARPRDKATDINAMFARSDVQAIMCSQGGATSNATLPFLDLDMIRRHPKPFIGMSDITVLLNAITAATGLVTFHGGDVMWGWGRQVHPYDQQQFVERLIDAKGGPVAANGERRAIRGGAGEGVLFGGNLGCLLRLAGTTYFPHHSDIVLLLEGINISAPTCHSMLWQLRQCGLFANCRGAIIGHLDGMDVSAGRSMEDILLGVTDDMSFPILKVADFGHNCPNTVLPVGARVLVDAESLSYSILDEFAVVRAAQDGGGDHV